MVERFESPCGRWIVLVDVDTGDTWRAEKLPKAEASALICVAVSSWSRIPHPSDPLSLSRSRRPRLRACRTSGWEVALIHSTA